MPIIENSRAADAILEQHLLDSIAFHDPALPQQQAEQLANTLLENTQGAVSIADAVRDQLDLPGYAIEDGIFTITAAAASQRRALGEFRNLITIHIFHHIAAPLIPLATQALKDTELWQKTWLSAYEHAAPFREQQTDLPQTPEEALRLSQVNLQHAADALYEAAATLRDSTQSTSIALRAAGTRLDDLAEHIELVATGANPRTIEERASSLLADVTAFRDSMATGPWGDALNPLLQQHEREHITRQLNAAAHALLNTPQPFANQRVYDHIRLPGKITAALEDIQTLHEQHPNANTPPLLSRTGASELALRTALDARSYHTAADALRKAESAITRLLADLERHATEELRAKATTLRANVADARAAAERLSTFHRDRGIHNVIAQYANATRFSHEQHLTQQQTQEQAESYEQGMMQAITL